MTEPARGTRPGTGEQAIALLGDSPDAIIIHRDGRIVYANAACARRLGVDDPATLVGRSLVALAHPDDRPFVRERLDACARGEPVGRAPMRLMRADGEPVTVFASPGLGQLEGELAEHLRIEDALRESEQRYRTLMEQASDGIVLVDFTGRFLSVNSRMAELLGYTVDELLALKLSDVLHPDDVADAPARTEELRQGRVLLSQRRLRRSDGSWIDVEISTRMFGGQLQSIVRDITERLGLEAQLRQAQKMEAIGRLAGGIAHDFNNLLTVITGYADVALDHLGEGSAVRGDVQEIRNAAQRAAQLTRQLLAFGRQQVLQPHVIQLGDIVVDSGRMLRRIIGEDVAIDVRRDPELWRVVADPNQIAQVLLNLAVNARDAMPTGGTLTIETANATADEALARRFAGLPAGEYVRLTVRDTGVGMTEEVMAQVFEPFFTTKGLGKGTGLGLSTVYGIVRQSGGFIYVESAPDAGATFTIFLPRAPAVSMIELASAAAPEAPLPAQTVLLVEDDAAVRAVARRLLERSGYRVIAADSGREALRMVDEGARPDLVLTDSIMPQMSGREVVEQLRARWPRIPVVFMSGHSREAVVMHGVLAADSVFLEKPYTTDQLMRALERARQLVAPNGG